MADALKDIMLKITDDDPATRGQKLWVMFALAVFLVASLNWYAMVREPQVVEVKDLVNHNRETVLVEGTVISWIEDRYGSGEDRVDLVVEDPTGVISVRWYSTGEKPPMVRMLPLWEQWWITMDGSICNPPGQERFGGKLMAFLK